MCLQIAHPPEVVAAITPWNRHGVEVDPVIVFASDDVISPFTHAAAVEGEAPLEAVKIDAAGSVEVDVRLCHVPSPVV